MSNTYVVTMRDGSRHTFHHDRKDLYLGTPDGDRDFQFWSYDCGHFSEEDCPECRDHLCDSVQGREHGCEPDGNACEFECSEYHCEGGEYCGEGGYDYHISPKDVSPTYSGTYLNQDEIRTIQFIDGPSPTPSDEEIQ